MSGICVFINAKFFSKLDFTLILKGHFLLKFANAYPANDTNTYLSKNKQYVNNGDN